MQLQASITKGLTTGIKVLWELAKVLIPSVIVIRVLENAGVLAYISDALGPVMGLFGLPGEGALVLVLANFVSTYSALAAMIALHLEWKQVTILCVMVLICHAAITETALVAKAGARASLVLVARVVAMVVVGVLLRFILPG